ncbi:GDSL-like Lipase/Acylhydrolase [Seiridium cupressi]
MREKLPPNPQKQKSKAIIDEVDFSLFQTYGQRGLVGQTGIDDRCVHQTSVHRQRPHALRKGSLQGGRTGRTGHDAVAISGNHHPDGLETASQPTQGCDDIPTGIVLAALMRSGTVDARNHWDRITQNRPEVEGPIAGGIPIRIMFMGASVTLGDHSTGSFGYRKQIRDWLVSLGNPVNSVGANRFGDFKDNDVQAFGAQPIKPTLDRAREIVLATQPNLILINAGSSDCFQEDNWGAKHSYKYTRELVDFLLAESPRATVIMSTVITCPWEHTEQCIKGVNAQIRQVATDLIREGKPIALAEMHFDQGLPNRPNLTHIGPDSMHPTDLGYFTCSKKESLTSGVVVMGDLFMEKIREVDRNGWLQPPVENGIPDDGDAARDAEEAAGGGQGNFHGAANPDEQPAHRRHSGKRYSHWQE